MRAVALTGIRKSAVVEVAEPRIEKPDDVLVGIRHVGICGSDVHYYTTGRIGTQVATFPWIVGHEAVGVVEAVGPAVTRVKQGDPVAVEPAVSCNHCDQCRAGRQNTCRHIKFISVPTQLPGALQERIVMPQENCFVLKDAAALPDAAIGEPLSIAVYSIRRGPSPEGKTIAILGAGPIGLCVLLALKAGRPGPIYITDKIDGRLEVASHLADVTTANPRTTDAVGAFLAAEPLGFDIVYECCGRQEALDQSLLLLKPGGTLVIVGIPEVDRISFDPSPFRQKDLTIAYVRRQNHCLQPALDLLESGQVDPTPLITHRLPLDQTPKAFDMVADYSDGVIKAMIDF